MQYLEYTEVGSCRPHYQRRTQADPPLTVLASLVAWYSRGTHHCWHEGPHEGWPGKRAPNNVSNCVSKHHISL